MQLRYYQRAAINATYNYLNYNEGNPCIVIPTGGGKTAVMATMCLDIAQRWHGRALVLSHVKELIDQTAGTLRRLAPDLSVGVYSAGLKSRDTDNSVLVAGIQSVYKKAEELGAFDLILIDEAHLIPPDGDGMYQTFLQSAKEKNKRVRLVGLTATPYRLKSGMICGKDNLLNAISYEVGVRELIDGGYLSHLISRGGTKKVDCSNLHIVSGEFDSQEVEDLMDNDYIVSSAIEDIRDKAAERKSILIFCSSVESAENFCNRYKAITGDSASLITGKTSTDERDKIIRLFKGEKIVDSLFGEQSPQVRVLVNVNVLTTGFDAPNVDCVVLLRPTASPGLYYQQVGRGLRICPGKSDCLILDYCGNIMRHGPIDVITPQDTQRQNKNTNSRQPVKECPECHLILHASFITCPECGFEFPKRDSSVQISTVADDASILSTGEPEETEYKVFETFYNIHEKRNAPEGSPRTIQIDYRIGLHTIKSEWVCPEHDGYARKKYEMWWNAHTADELHAPRIEIPKTCEEFMDYAYWGCFAEPESIVYESTPGKKYGRIKSCKLKEIPSYESILEKIQNSQNQVSDYDLY